jgi:hypothetical protein
MMVFFIRVGKLKQVGLSLVCRKTRYMSLLKWWVWMAIINGQMKLSVRTFPMFFQEFEEDILEMAM